MTKPKCPTLAGFERQIGAAPNDETLWLVAADHLQDSGNDKLARRFRWAAPGCRLLYEAGVRVHRNECTPGGDCTRFPEDAPLEAWELWNAAVVSEPATRRTRARDIDLPFFVSIIPAVLWDRVLTPYVYGTSSKDFLSEFDAWFAVGCAYQTLTSSDRTAVLSELRERHAHKVHVTE